MWRLPWALAAGTAIALLPACQAGDRPDVATSTTTVAPVSSPAPGGTAAERAVIQRFTHDIWPAVVAYNLHRTQNGPENRQYLTIIDHGLGLDAWTGLRAAVQRLGTVTAPDDTQGGVVRDPQQGLHLADVHVTARTAADSTLHVCFTFTAMSDAVAPEQPILVPTSAEVTVELRYDTDDWHLHAMTDEHVVPSCAASAA